MRVIATAVGLAGTVKQPGEEFDCPKNAQGQEIVKASWYKPKPEPEEQSEGGSREQRRQQRNQGNGGNKLVDE